MENPRKGRLRNVEEAEHFLAGGDELGKLTLQMEFLWEKVAGNDEQTLLREYEQFLLRKRQEVIDDIDRLVEQ